MQRQGKPETGPLHPALLGTETLERHEYPVPQLEGDPRAGVGHQDREGAPDLGLPAGKRDHAVLPVVLHGIGQQIQKDLDQALAVCSQVALGGVKGHTDLDPPLFGSRTDEIQGVLHHVADSHRFE